MEEQQKTSSHASSGRYLIAFLFVFTGLLLLARNMGIITEEGFNLLVAWHSLFIITGIYSLIRRRYIFGSILLLIGIYLLGGVLMLFNTNVHAMIWPLILIFTGFLVLSNHHRRNRERHKTFFQRRMEQRKGYAGKEEMHGQQCQSENGFLYSNSSFSGVRHVVLDELFKGAKLHTSFGSIVVDLRHTHIEPGNTYIDLECNFGGVELYIPDQWKVRIECNCFCGGCEDKRWKNTESTADRILVIRGNVSFGGLEVKD